MSFKSAFSSCLYFSKLDCNQLCPISPFLLYLKLFLLISNIHSDARIFSEHQNETIRHVVCFKFKESAKKTEIERVEKEFSALKDKIPGILSRMGKE